MSDKRDYKQVGANLPDAGRDTAPVASSAACAGLRAGDRVASLSARAASSISPLRHEIATTCDELASGQALLLAIDRDGESRIAALETP